MAIPFLNNISLTNNEIQNVRLHNTGTSNAAAGQIFFNTGVNLAQYYANAIDQWVSLKEYSFGNGTYINANVTGTGAKPIITPDLSAVDGTSTAASMFLTKDNEWATIPFGDITAVLPGTYISIDNSTGPEPTVNHDLTTRTDTPTTSSPGYGGDIIAVKAITTNATGHITIVETETYTLPASDNTDDYVDSVAFDTATGVLTLGRTGALVDLTKNLDGRYGLIDNQTVELTGDITGTGTTSIATTISAGAVDFAMVNPADVITESEGIGNNDNDTTWPTTAAVKDYVDSSTAGQLVYQGAYNAATNTPNLDNTPTITIKIGFTWTVTADGDFYGEQVSVGDLLIAEIDTPTSLADWTTVQNNIDLADGNTPGIGNVVPGSSNTITAPYTSGTATLDVVDSTASQKGAVIVDGSDPITVTYNSGTATVGIEDSAAAQKGAVIVSGGTGIDVAYASGTATVTNTDTNATNTNASGTIAIGALSGTTTHNFGTKNTIVQTIDQDGDTVFCDITRTTNTCVATIATAQTAATGGIITILVQKIG